MKMAAKRCAESLTQHAAFSNRFRCRKSQFPRNRVLDVLRKLSRNVLAAHFVFDKGHNGVIEIFAAQIRIAADRNVINRCVVHFQNCDIESAAARVVNQNAPRLARIENRRTFSLKSKMLLRTEFEYSNVVASTWPRTVLFILLA